MLCSCTSLLPVLAYSLSLPFWLLQVISLYVTSSRDLPSHPREELEVLAVPDVAPDAAQWSDGGNGRALPPAIARLRLPGFSTPLGSLTVWCGLLLSVPRFIWGTGLRGLQQEEERVTPWLVGEPVGAGYSKDLTHLRKTWNDGCISESFSVSSETCSSITVLYILHWFLSQNLSKGEILSFFVEVGFAAIIQMREMNRILKVF